MHSVAFRGLVHTRAVATLTSWGTAKPSPIDVRTHRFLHVDDECDTGVFAGRGNQLGYRQGGQVPRQAPDISLALGSGQIMCSLQLPRRSLTGASNAASLGRLP